MASGNRLTRREFLAGSIGAGIGLSALWSSGTVAGLRRRVEANDPVRVEPRPPADHLSFVSRPDLTPVGVSITRSPAFVASDLRSMYLFCAPKSPLAANAGHASSRPDNFPAGASPGLMILDTAGELVFFKPLPGPYRIPFNFRVQTYKDRPTLTWFEGHRVGAHGVGHYYLADDSYQTIAQVESTRYPADLHEFILTPEGTALHTAYEPGVTSDRGLPLVVGHAQEVDVATNALLFDWPCYPAVRPELSYTGPYGDYFHINSIGLWPGPERNLVISSRNTSTVFLVDRATKQVIWQLGGKKSDFEMGPGSVFWYQHDARSLADGSGISLFDDASQPSPEKFASGKVLTLDQASRRATLRRRLLHTDHEFSTPSQGNCQLLPDGGHVVGWGFLPFFSAFAAEEDALPALILDGRFPDGAASYRTFLFEWIGRPPESELALVVRPSGGAGRFSAWVSWNGSTEVGTWQLEAGSSPSELAPVSKAAKEGFETRIEVDRVGATNFRAVALDASGRVLGRSATVEVA